MYLAYVWKELELELELKTFSQNCVTVKLDLFKMFHCNRNFIISFLNNREYGVNVI